jgi:hypothetical protein
MRLRFRALHPSMHHVRETAKRIFFTPVCQVSLDLFSARA